jgi:hypothetical protein
MAPKCVQGLRLRKTSAHPNDGYRLGADISRFVFALEIESVSSVGEQLCSTETVR